MNEKFEHKGYFFLPESPGIRVAGILSFLPGENILIEIFGSLNGDFGLGELLDLKSEKIIQGDLSNSKKVTLINCTVSFDYNLSSSFPLIKYRCSYLVVGGHLNDITEKKFDFTNISFSNLFEWLGERTIKVKMKFDEQNSFNEANFNISKSLILDRCFQIDQKCNIHLISGNRFYSESNSEAYHLREEPFVKLVSHNEKESIIYFKDKALLFRQFLEFAFLKPVAITELTLYDKNNFQGKGKNKLFHRYDLFFDENINQPPAVIDHALFDFKEVSEYFGDIIKKWFSINAELAPIRNHLLDSIRPKKFFNSNDFLIIIQSLEGYHQRFIKSKVKEPKLKDRLKELTTKFEFVELIRISCIDIQKVVSTRGYYSHFYPNKKNVLEGKDLYNLTNDLRKLLICCVLDLLGFNQELINEVITNYFKR
ncbi:MAG: HEPN domain-containing protein [Lentimicrobiaceae bacterium]